MVREISNEDFNRALNDINNVLIMEKACSNFRQNISHDELIECKLFALWEAMKHWRPNGKKFTSFLYQKTVWECIKVINKKKKDRHKNISIDKPVKENVNIKEILEILPEDLQDIIHKRYIEKMTLREISEIYQCCHETARQKIFMAIKILKKKHKMEYNKVGSRI